MTTKTLRTLIDDTINNDNLMVVMPGDVTALHKKISKILDLYEEDNSHPLPTPFVPTQGFMVGSLPDEVPYGEICGCNTKNGGSGICGCVMGNKMVPNPKKHGMPMSNWETTTQLHSNGTAFTNTPGNTSLTIKTTNA